MHICKHCQRSFKNGGGLATHEPYCKLNPNKVTRIKSINAHARKGKVPWNKGLAGDERCKHTDETKLRLKQTSTGTALTPELEKERRAKISKQAKLKNGGYRQGSGRGKKGWYKEFFCDSSYELAYVIYCIDHNISIQRNKQKLEYVWNGKRRNYIPDFIVNERLVEIKGYKSEQWLAKINSNPHVLVLYEADLKTIFDYVISKYGKDFIKMYELR